MMPAYKEYTHFTEYTSPNGRLYVTISRAPKQCKPLAKVVKHFLTTKRYALARQKILGLALLVLGIVTAFIFSGEDVTASFVLVLLGTARLVCD